MRLSDIRILYKIFACFGLLGLVVGGAIWFSAIKMQNIDEGFNSIIDGEASAMKSNIRATVAVMNGGRLMWKMIAQHDPAEIDRIAAEMEANQKLFDEMIADGKTDTPQFAERFAKSDMAFNVIKARFPEVKSAAVTNNQDEELRLASEIDGEIVALRGEMKGFTEELVKDMDARAAQEVADTQSAIFTTAASVAGALVAVLGMAFFIVQNGIAKPLGRLSGIMARLAKGEFDATVEGATRRDEVGLMAKSVEVFKQNGIEAIRLRKQQEEDKIKAEEERRRAEAAAIAGERELVTNSFGAGMIKLASKDLSYRTTEQLPEAYGKLQNDFNSALDQLEDAIEAVSGSTRTINSGTQEISSASDDLSRRTESQAANLEETAAAVAEITGTVKKTAAGAGHARDVVASAKDDAAKSGEVVKKAIDAMNGIEKSSQQITQIIGVIDEIAFQTNLLALNAGVEAARAGDAGRGFAVVASEVRALAQRSADAAKEIKSLIAASRSQVEQGVKLVGETGTSLERIVERVMEINKVVAEIAASAEEQATGLQQVNTAVDQMDQATQQNAAMVEEATAATRNLAQQSDDLNTIVGGFVTRARVAVAHGRREPARPNAKPVAPAHKPAPMASSRAPAPVKKKVSGGGGEGWEEF